MPTAKRYQNATLMIAKGPASMNVRAETARMRTNTTPPNTDDGHHQVNGLPAMREPFSATQSRTYHDSPADASQFDPTGSQT